jgi:hypothetical protein
MRRGSRPSAARRALRRFCRPQTLARLPRARASRHHADASRADMSTGPIPCGVNLCLFLGLTKRFVLWTSSRIFPRTRLVLRSPCPLFHCRRRIRFHAVRGCKCFASDSVST